MSHKSKPQAASMSLFKVPHEQCMTPACKPCAWQGAAPHTRLSNAIVFLYKDFTTIIFWWEVHTPQAFTGVPTSRPTGVIMS